MKHSLADKVVWTLNRLDKTHELTDEYLKGRIYISDAHTQKKILYNPEDASQSKYHKVINTLHQYAEKSGYKVDIFHITTGEVFLASDKVNMDNYLFITDDDDFYRINYDDYGCVMAHVENAEWDVQESGSIRVENKGGILVRVV